MNKLNVQHYTNEHQDRVTQMTETIDKQTVIAKTTHITHQGSEHIGYVKLKRGRDYCCEFYVDQVEDIDIKIKEVNDISWIEEQMKQELSKLIGEMGDKREASKVIPTILRSKIN